jgi:hypothetical protein
MSTGPLTSFSFAAALSTVPAGRGVYRILSGHGYEVSAIAQRIMARRAGATVTEVAGSHAIYVSQPKAVAAFIERAAEELARSDG